VNGRAPNDERVLVTGGTGTLGRLVVARLRCGDFKLRVLSRQSHENEQGIEFVRGDLATGEGVEAAVERAAIIVHCAGTRKGDDDKALNLVRPASEARARHLVNISVVGADRIPVTGALDRVMFGYFAMKLAAERVVAESGLPWRTLRATQFYDLILTVMRWMARLPAIPAPTGFRASPSTLARWPTGSSSLRLASPPAWCPTSPDRGCTRSPNCFADT
jgi:uncharacterized protein YbjT (DUF2867 family)